MTESPPYKIILAKVGLVLVLILATYLQFSNFDDQVSPSRSFKEMWNLGHVFLYALLVYLLLGWKPIRLAPIMARWAGLLTLTLLLGVLVEWLQLGTSRSSEWLDVLRDLAGALLVLSFTTLPERASIWLVAGLRGVALGLVLLLCAPLLTVLVDEYQARSSFPVLADFSGIFEESRWSGNASRELVDMVGRGRLMRVEMGTQTYSSVSLDYFPGDWSGFDSLQAELHLPDEPALKVTLRVHDVAHGRGPDRMAFDDRYNESFILDPGWNLIRVPLERLRQAPVKREMDLTEIRNLRLFVAGLQTPRILYVGTVKLVE